jgi:diaminopimelate decarboxylase
MENVYFHGNNKTPQELEFALDCGIGRIVIDSFHELDVLEGLAGEKGVVQNVFLRLSPSIDPHTHIATTTGILDSKFGFSIETRDADSAIRQAIAAKNLDLVGIHFHLGSPIFELEPYPIAIDTVLTYLAPFKAEGLNLREFSPGGGFAIGYVRDQPPPAIGDYAEVITDMLKRRAGELGFGQPKLIVEPGRSIVGRAGVALYTVGGIKNIPTVRKYVSVDGGMGDNIRPAIYGSRYEAALANRMSARPEEKVTIAGKYCESGDVLIRDITLPVIESGDIIAIPSSGAYAPSMASNYNLNGRPPIVVAKDGHARLIRRRESFEDMMHADVV